MNMKHNAERRFDMANGWALALTRTSITAFAAAVLVACGGSSSSDKPATQTAAKVNKEEITVHQINAVLSQRRNLNPEQTEAASFQVLQGLVDQELAVQKAAELKIDRDPQVMQRIEAARREIIARAYADKIGEGAAAPTADEVSKYYNDNPALFKERRVYQLQEVAIEVAADQQAAVRDMIASAKNAPALVEKLKAANMKFAGNQATRAAEQLPLAAVGELAKLKEGESVVRTGPKGLTVVYLVSAVSQPVALDRASKPIEQYLLNDRKRKLIRDDVKALRDAATISYQGKFADAASAAPKGVVAADEPASAPAIPGVVDPVIKAASDVDIQSINKGLGLK
jgi:EpsD family peptidyl-prolyl cis-trans isomerase